MKHLFRMQEIFGSLLADGTRGAKFRFCEVEPILSRGGTVIFDFSGVDNMTDSFANACFGVLAQSHREELGKRVRFVHHSSLIHDFLAAAISRGLTRPRSFA
ncbi:MAG TPA: STAS-like domain-containing protein [Candidatus Udaeobacter sp.]|nr:STAS-like domain-containing protein [Candidatus Udaeobacter sp.]